MTKKMADAKVIDPSTIKKGFVAPPEPEDPNNPNIILSVPRKMMLDTCCPMLQMKGTKPRCAYLGVSAELSENSKREAICSRQLAHWSGRTTPCGIPKALEKTHHNLFSRARALQAEARMVYAKIAQANPCPRALPGQGIPRCKPLQLDCASIEDFNECMVFRALLGSDGILRGQEELDNIQAAYDREIQKRIEESRENE